MNQERIDKIKKNYTELKRELENPANFSKPEKLKKLNQDLSEIEEIIAEIKKIEETQRQFAENEKFLKEENSKELLEMSKLEKIELKAILEKAETNLEKLLLPSDPRDKKSIIIEIRAGAGGDEASFFVGELFKMYSRYAEKNNWRTELNSSSPNALGGFK